MSPEEIYLQHLRTIERIAAFVGRRAHLSADELAEFTQEVRVRLLDDDYAVIRKFQGRSEFSTYLTTVIGRLHHQWRVEQWGKWRPSAEAKRLGEKAVTLERLIARDGFTFAEAVQILTTPADSVFTKAELEELYDRLPSRAPRPVLIPDEELPESAAVTEASDDRIQEEERRRTARQTARTIDDVIATMDAEDRVILQMRFWDAKKVPDIARSLQIEQKKLYKRLDKMFGVLRRGLERAGVTKDEVARLLSRGDQEIPLRFAREGGIDQTRPSHRAGGKELSGDGRLQ